MTDRLESRLARLGALLEEEGRALDVRVARELDHTDRPSPPVALPRSPRRRVLVSALVALGLVAAAGGWVVWQRNDGTSPNVATPVTTGTPPATTTACGASEGASTAPRSGHSRSSFAIRNVQVLVNACATTVVFYAGAGDWRVAYAPSGSTGLTVDLDGAHAATDGLPDEWILAAPSVASRVTRVRHRNDAAEPGTHWSIRLDRKRPFTAATTTIGGNSVFAITIAAPRTGPLRCRIPEPPVDFTVPDGWYVEMTRDCGLLSPKPIAITPFVGSNAAVQIFAGIEPDLVIGPTTAGPTTVDMDGRSVTTSEATDAQSGARQYKVVLVSIDGTVISIVGVTRPPQPGTPRRAALSELEIHAAVDAIAQSASSP